MDLSNDEEWAKVSAEIPKPEDAFFQKYLQGREALISEEKRQRSDHLFRQSLSPIAKRACEIVDRIRNHEKKTIWTPDLEEQIAQREDGVTMFPGMMFNQAKETMEKTKLWKIVRRMPKGALLHAHCDAMVDFTYVFNVVLSTPGMHITCPTAGGFSNAAALRENLLSIRFREITSSLPGSAIWEAGYEADTFVELTKAADAFPGGGREGFLAWLKGRCTISQTDAVEQHHGVDEIWRKFHGCFLVIGSIIHYEPIWRAFLRRLMEMLAEDKVYWTEIRFAWPLNYCKEGCETPETDYNAMFQVIEEEVQAFKSTPAGSSFWGLRMIWTSLRILPTRQIVTDMDHCITTKLSYPHLIAGYDLVGHEDSGRTLHSLLPELFWFRSQCAAEGVEIPFFFHAGECLGDGDSTDNNLFDAILLGTRRIGHGFSLYKHPSLIAAVRDRRVLVESCPISNEVLRLCGSILSHPLPALLARGVACALNNDDPAILGHDAAGMTHDFWQALQGWENLGLAGLASLAENSVRWAAFEDQDASAWKRDVSLASLGEGVKAERLKAWRVEWEEFCLWIVSEFGEDTEGNVVGLARDEAREAGEGLDQVGRSGHTARKHKAKISNVDCECGCTTSDRKSLFGGVGEIEGVHGIALRYCAATAAVSSGGTIERLCHAAGRIVVGPPQHTLHRVGGFAMRDGR